jgi:phosphatidylserine/phosphatidylglycerophosphate/cardiolipin synthase-like enzyme
MKYFLLIFTPLCLFAESYAIFNNPFGNKQEQKIIINHIIELINNTPSKGSISVGLYSFDDKDVAKALIRAADRGVIVKLALDKYGEHYKENKKRIDKGKYENRTIIKMLKDKIDKLTICGDKKSKTIQSCISNKKNSIHHEKYFLFSLTYNPVSHKKMKNVVLITSSNMTNTAQSIQWNDLFVSYGDKEEWYMPWYKHFQEQLNQKRNSNYFNPKFYTGYIQSAKSGYEAYFSPSSKKDIVESILKKAKGDSLGRCSLLVNQAYFSSYRKKVLNQFIRIKDIGCDVRILVAKTKSFSKKVRKQLDKAGIKYNYMLYKKRYTHHKFILYEGDYGKKKRQKIVWLGSHNLTYNANRYNDEVIVKVPEEHIFYAYKKHFNNYWKKFKKQKVYISKK